jgi:hypothetical protein
MSDSQILHRRAIEALRAGVPNRDAVAALGTSQPEIELRFIEHLDLIRELPRGAPNPGGILIGGGFGSGKSHLLEHLQHLALERQFVVSKIVVSKETPLHDPVKVFRAAVEAAIVPNHQGNALMEIATSLRTESEAYVDLYRWVNDPMTGLNARFAATLYLFENLRYGDQEFTDLIVRFWGGDPMRVGDLRTKLREAGAGSAYQLASIKERDLALQRFRFVSRLIKAAGFAGWVLLIDEVELIGRYTVLQRAKSYGELARLIRGFDEDSQAPITSVLAITDDFARAVLSDKNDREEIPNRLRAKQTTADDLLAGHAEEGMRIIDRELVHLQSPTSEELERTYERLRAIHGDAYGWSPPDVEGIEQLPTNRMRQYVRAWINEWDLFRLDPRYHPDIEVIEVELGYGEDKDLETASEETSEADGE